MTEKNGKDREFTGIKATFTIIFYDSFGMSISMMPMLYKTEYVVYIYYMVYAL